jgi:hypothetical protein
MWKSNERKGKEREKGKEVKEVKQGKLACWQLPGDGRKGSIRYIPSNPDACRGKRFQPLA